MDRSAIILVIPIAEKHQWTFLNKLNPSWVLTAAKKNVSAVTKHCPRDPWFPNYPASISLWECQNYVLSPIYSFHPNELALMLTKSDSNISKQNACCLCNSPMSNNVASEPMSWCWQHCNRDFLPETVSQSRVSASDSLWLRLFADTFS